VLLVFLLLSTEFALCSGKIVLGYVELPPYTFTAVNGRAKGLFIDIATQTLGESGIEFETRSLPAKRLYYELAQGEIDLFLGITSSPLIKDKFFSSQRKIGRITLNMYFRSSDKPVTGEQDLIGKRVGLINGFSYANLGEFVTDNAATTTYLAIPQSGFTMLERERLDFFLYYEDPVNASFNSFTLKDINKYTLFSLDCFFVLSRKTPDAAQIMEKINLSFNRLFP